MNIKQHVVALTSGTRVFVNGTEVTGAPVTVPVKVEVVEPLPPLPMVELAAFTSSPTCTKCRSRSISWTYRSGYHQPYPGLFTPSSSEYCPIPVHIYSAWYIPESDAERTQRYAREKQKFDTVPPHHDLTCDRCSHRWAIGVAPEAAA